MCPLLPLPPLLPLEYFAPLSFLFRYNEVGGEAFRACVAANPPPGSPADSPLRLLSDCCGHDGSYGFDQKHDADHAPIPGVEISVEDIADYAWEGNTAMP